MLVPLGTLNTDGVDDTGNRIEDADGSGRRIKEPFIEQTYPLMVLITQVPIPAATLACAAHLRESFITSGLSSHPALVYETPRSLAHQREILWGLHG